MNEFHLPLSVLTAIFQVDQG